MSIKWWEKTVEYQFVMLVARAKKLFLSPLDGVVERAGDAILSAENRWILIEFKKDISSISDEKTKFIQYEQAKAALSSFDSHHHIIYGRESKKAANRLQLCSQTYFSGVSSNLTGILKSGAEFEFFANYLKQFTEFKKRPGGGGGSGIDMSDYALVAGVNADNNIVECLSLAEFLRHWAPERKKELYFTGGFEEPGY